MRTSAEIETLSPRKAGQGSMARGTEVYRETSTGSNLTPNQVRTYGIAAVVRVPYIRNPGCSSSSILEFAAEACQRWPAFFFHPRGPLCAVFSDNGGGAAHNWFAG